jgi:hypothetical protein
MINLKTLLSKPFKDGSFTQRILSKSTVRFSNKPSTNEYTYHLVTQEEEMRMDLISVQYYGTSDHLDILCKFNNISNPFSLERGQLLRIPNSPKKYYINIEDIIDKGTIKATPNLIPVSTKDKARLDYLKRLGTAAAPPNVTLPNDKNIKVENGRIIFGADVTKVNKQDCPTPISRSNVLKNLIESKIFK